MCVFLNGSCPEQQDLRCRELWEAKLQDAPGVEAIYIRKDPGREMIIQNEL